MQQQITQPKGYTVQLDLFSLDLDELQTVTRERGHHADEATGEHLAATLELAEAMSIARERLTADRDYGEWWAGTGLKYSRPWRATLVEIGIRWRKEGKPGVNPVNTDGSPFVLKRYAEGLDPYDKKPSKISENDSKGTDEYFTPAWVFDKLGVVFDLDVCSPPEGTNVPCRNYIAPPADGLAEQWYGTIWMNPPYSEPAPWVERFIEHGHGIALLPFAKSGWFFDLWHHPKIDIATTDTNLSKFDGGQIFMPCFLAAIGDVRAALTEIGTVR